MDILEICNNILDVYSQRVGIRPLPPPGPARDEEKGTTTTIAPTETKTLYVKVPEPKSSIGFTKPEIPPVPESVREYILSRGRKRFNGDGVTVVETGAFVD